MVRPQPGRRRNDSSVFSCRKVLPKRYAQHSSALFPSARFGPKNLKARKDNSFFFNAPQQAAPRTRRLRVTASRAHGPRPEIPLTRPPAKTRHHTTPPLQGAPSFFPPFFQSSSFPPFFLQKKKKTKKKEEKKRPYPLCLCPCALPLRRRRVSSLAVFLSFSLLLLLSVLLLDPRRDV